MLGWKTNKHYYETDELPNPRPTQPKKKWHLGHFSPQQIHFRALGLILYGKQTTKNPNKPISPQTPYWATSNDTMVDIGQHQMIQWLILGNIK